MRIARIIVLCLLATMLFSCAKKETTATVYTIPTAFGTGQYSSLPELIPAALLTDQSPMPDPKEIIDPTDPNVTSVILTEQTTGRPATEPLLIHTKSGLVNWTPAIGDAGIYKVRLIVSDGELEDYEDITITVIESNKPPYIFAKIDRKDVGWHIK